MSRCQRELIRKLEFRHPVNQINITADHVPLRLLHHPGNPVISRSQTEQEIPLATLHVQRMLLVHPHPQRFCQPIRVHPALYHFQLFVIQLIQHHLVRRRPIHRLVPPRQPFELQLLPRVHQVITRQIRHREIHVSRVTHLQFPRLRFHGLHHDYPVGRLRTVNRRRGRVFQDRDRGHPVYIQVINGRQR